MVIATKAAQKHLNKMKIKYDAVYRESEPENNEILNRANKKTITIYDITLNKALPKDTIIYVGDHINKTGENPLIGKKTEPKERFFDIRNIYFVDRKKTSITTTSLGLHFSKTTTENYPSTDIANIAILCKFLKFKTIKGRLINT